MSSDSPDPGADPVRRADLRIGDAERDAVAEVLRTAFAEGRLSDGELDERLAATYAAKTAGELVPLTRDLPPVGAVRPSPPPAPAAPPAPAGPAPARHRSAWLRALWGAWAVAVSVNVVIWLIVSISSADLAYFWPAWVAGPWGAVLLALTVMGWHDHGGESSGR
jgi:hypothetical protein